MGLLVRDSATLIVVDVQEGFRGYPVFASVAQACATLLQAARILEVPRLVSEQYPKGLGPTAPEVGLHDERPIEKTVFSAARALERMDRAGAVVSTVEAALFELLERAGTPEFKAVQKLIL